MKASEPTHPLELIHRGSVKDIYQLTANELLFRFSNRYSIFDWGEMPDAIPGKGAALSLMGQKLLAHLEKKGVKTHYLKPGERPEDMIVQSVAVPRGNMAAYQQSPTHTLVPLEVIYRFGAPKGSSLLKKYTTEKEWKAAGFDRQYREGEDFSEIAIDLTTKLERIDRPLSYAEAQTLAGMNSLEWNHLLTLTRSIAKEICAVFAASGMKLWDGKFEFAFTHSVGSGTESRRELMLVDTIGLDEIRLTYEGKPLSKELLRQYYLNTSWYTALSRAKTASPTDFKEYCIRTLGQSPETLPLVLINATGTLYTAVAELLLSESLLNKEKNQELHQKLQTALKTLTEGISSHV